MRKGATLLAGFTATALATATGVAWHSSAAYADEEVPEPDSFTSMFTAEATPDTPVDPDGESVPGEEGASGTFNLMINSDEEIVCWENTLDGVTPPYESPARTATHIHESPEGVQGPPRLSFPDPEEDDDGMLRSSGCVQGPFTTGLDDDDDVDTGEGFTLSQIEDAPSQFYGDTHTEEYPMGAVRGQLTEVPIGGMETGAGGTAEAASAPSSTAIALGVGSAAALLMAIAVGWRRAVR